MSNFNMTKREELLSTISDMYKDAFGVRPHGMFNEYSEQELLEEIDRLQVEVEEAIEHEQKTDALLITKFNDEVATFIQQGAANRFTAIRWMLQAQGYDETLDDADYICYNNGINPYIPAGKAIFAEVEAAIISLSN